MYIDGTYHYNNEDAKEKLIESLFEKICKDEKSNERIQGIVTKIYETVCNCETTLEIVSNADSPLTNDEILYLRALGYTVEGTPYKTENSHQYYIKVNL